jgi:photosystem II stability/assembly factor-like uncharacterized protein
LADGVLPGADDLDFRDTEAWGEQNALVLSSGPGDKSRLYQTKDGGQHWVLLFTNPDPQGFFDAVSFWDRQRGIILGDPVGGRFVVLTFMGTATYATCPGWGRCFRRQWDVSHGSWYKRWLVCNGSNPTVYVFPA